MNVSSKKEYLVYFFGDVLVFAFSLWLALSLRYLSFPSGDFFLKHLTPFSFLFACWIFIFYVAGLYDKQTAILKKKLPLKIINAQIVNGAVGVFFFYFSPYFGITPKTNLLIYLLVSSILIILWRIIGVRFFKIGRKQSVIVLSNDQELEEIAKELKENGKYNIKNLFLIDIKKSDTKKLKEEVEEKVQQGASFIIADFQDEKMQSFISQLYGLLFSGVVFFDAQKVYEELFDKIPLSLVKKHWLLENLSLQRTIHDSIKRVVDFLLSFPLAILSLVAYPFIFLAIKIDDRGSLFIAQERIGQNGVKIKIVKFRSMKVSDSGVWLKKEDKRITKVGSFLRKTRLDELPQLWNVVRGDLSLIGPRPDISGLRERLESEIPYYNIRDLVRPGLSGWAQIKQGNPPQSIEETRERLMYDFYYIKNRSIFFDLKIGLRTIQILLSRAGV